MNNRKQSDLLFRRANQVIPTGIYGHVAPGAGLPLDFPHFCQSGNGCRFIDVDGKEWLDFMCGFGAVLHGYRNPLIDGSVEKQHPYGAVFNQPSQLMVELAEKLVEQIDFAEWAVFAKNGSDLTTWAIRVAREQTGREYVIKARGAYHGVDAWCDPGLGGRIASDRSHILEFEWNDFDQLESLFRKYSGKIAAVILTPYHHPSFGPSILPIGSFWNDVETLCRSYGTALVLDDVRCGWRLHDGGSHKYFGFTPDLAIYSKALGNGYAISACIGSGFFRAGASEVFLTGSCWNDAFAMAAALACLKLVKDQETAESVLRKGTLFCEQLESIAQKCGIPLRMTGVRSMPYPWIEGDDNYYQIQTLCKIAASYGLYFHPHHNWFISNAMNDQDLEQAILLSTEAFEHYERENLSQTK
ncbi:MAG: aminotransferase class III-fold pyridoxal phosphate-dependent enzyme [Opitutae bacterium]